MKKILFLFMIVLLLVSCHKDKPIVVQPYIPADLIGKWKITEIFDTDGGSAPLWRVYNTAEEYDIWFKDNSDYTQPGTSTCYAGKYSVSEALKITFVNSCGDISIETIDSLSAHELIIDANWFEFMKTRYVKVAEY